MKNRFILGIVLLVLFSTFISQKKISIKKLKIQNIVIENNKIIEKQEIINDISFLYNKNLIFLNPNELNRKIKKKSFIKKLQIKKIYPNKLVIKVFEKEPIAILIDNNKKKFYLGKKIDLIEYKKISKYENLPVVKGNKKNFKILYNNLTKVNFPLMNVSNFNYLKTNRWDIQMKDKKIIKLPSKNYTRVLKNFMTIRKKTNFDKYMIFDYRLNNQLILK